MAKKAEWQRSTTAISIEQISPDTMAAVREYLDERAGIPEAFDNVTDVWQTVSVNSGGRFKKDQTVVDIVALGADWMVRVALDSNRMVTWEDVKAIRLKDLRIQDYETSSLASIQPDTGLTITWQGEGPDPSATFMGLGPEPAASDLRQRLHQLTSLS